jgi:hypothetical protein
MYKHTPTDRNTRDFALKLTYHSTLASPDGVRLRLGIRLRSSSILFALSLGLAVPENAAGAGGFCHPSPARRAKAKLAFTARLASAIFLKIYEHLSIVLQLAIMTFNPRASVEMLTRYEWTVHLCPANIKHRTSNIAKKL